MGLGMITVIVVLKYDSQNSKLIYVLVIHMIFFRQALFIMSSLRCLQDMWLGPGVEDEKHLAIIFLNS